MVVVVVPEVVVVVVEVTGFLVVVVVLLCDCEELSGGFFVVVVEVGFLVVVVVVVVVVVPSDDVVLSIGFSIEEDVIPEEPPVSEVVCEGSVFEVVVVVVCDDCTDELVLPPCEESVSEQEDIKSPPARTHTVRQASDMYFFIGLLLFIGSPFVKKRLSRFENDSIL